MHRHRISLAHKVQVVTRFAALDEKILRGDFEPVDGRWIGQDFGKVFDPQAEAEAQVRARPRRRSAGEDQA